MKTIGLSHKKHLNFIQMTLNKRRDEFLTILIQPKCQLKAVSTTQNAACWVTFIHTSIAFTPCVVSDGQINVKHRLLFFFLFIKDNYSASIKEQCREMNYKTPVFIYLHDKHIQASLNSMFLWPSVNPIGELVKLYPWATLWHWVTRNTATTKGELVFPWHTKVTQTQLAFFPSLK